MDYTNYVSFVIDMGPHLEKTLSDSGCGDGKISSRIIEMDNEVTGFDYYERA